MKYLFVIIAIAAIPILNSIEFTRSNYPKMIYDDYATQWAEIEKLENEGLFQSALKKVESLYIRSLKESNTEQRIKTLIYKSKFRQTLEEESELSSFVEMENELEKLVYPGKQILASYLADFYLQYYRANSYIIDQRTHLDKDYNLDELSEWSRQAYINRMQLLQFLATEQLDLKNVKLDSFNALIRELDSKGFEFRDNMYDLLAFKAIEFFGDEYLFSNDKFTENSVEELYFLSPDKFVSVDFDSLNSPFFKILKLYQHLFINQLETKDEKLVDIDLKRLDFVYRKSNLENKDSLYLGYLQNYLDELKNSVTMVRLSNELAKYYIQKAPSYSPENPEYKDYYNKAAELLNRAINAYPDDYFARDSKNLLKQMMRKELSITIENIWSPDKHGIGLLSYRNVKKLYFRVYQVNPNQFVAPTYTREENVMQKLMKGDLIKSWSVNIPETNDFHKHDLEFAIDPLSLGTYAILASANDEFSFQSNALGYSLFSISDLSYVQIEEEGKNQILVYNRKSGYPADNVTVKVYKDKYNYNKDRSERELLLEQKTDINGLVTFILPDSRNVYRVELKKDNDNLILRDYYSSNNRYYSKERSNVILMTDRAIYRPGQISYVKGLVVHYDEKGIPTLVPNAKGQLVFRDANRKVRYEYDFTSNEYGSFNQSFILPSDGLNGNMTIHSIYQNSRQSKSIRVEEYKRPKFKVEFETPTEAFAINDSVYISGFAKNYNGVLIDGAQVKYTVSRLVYNPWRYGFMYRTLYPQNENPKIISSGELISNKEGRFTIDFESRAPKSRQWRNAPAYIFKIQVDVTDQSGETQSASYDLKLSEKAFFLNAIIPERTESKKFESIELSGENLNGGLVPIKGEIVIEKLKEPENLLIQRKWAEPDVYLYDHNLFKNYFPDRPFKTEDRIEDWSVRELSQTLKFNIESTDKIQINNLLKSGSYKITLIGVDQLHNKDSIVRYIQIDDFSKCDLAYGKNIAIDINKEDFQPGEVLEVKLVSNKAKTPLFYTLEKDGETTNTWLKIKDKFKIEIPVAEDHRGGFNIHFLYVHNNKFNIEQKYIRVPWDNKDLDISFEVFRDELIPGQKEQWSIKVKDVFDKPQKVELLASMYDASLDAFADNQWGTPNYPLNYSQISWSNQCHDIETFNFLFKNWHEEGIYNLNYFNYPMLNTFGMYFSRGNYAYADYDAAILNSVAEPRRKNSEKIMKAPELEMADMAGNGLQREEVVVEQEDEKPKVSVRENLNELVFFYPELYADENGDVSINFTMNEALTSWKFMSFAHTKDLKFGLANREIKTSKDLMVFPNLPRFFRQGDEIFISGKIQNVLDTVVEVTAMLEFFDPINLKDNQYLNDTMKNITLSIDGNSATSVSWKVKIDKNAILPLGVRMIAVSDEFSDGEQQVIPVVPNRMLVTESYSLPLKSNERRRFDLSALNDVLGSSTADMYRYTIEISSNPAWYAVQALPYLMEYPFDCTEQVFSRLYANTLASYIANSNPNIKSVFDQWKNSDALLSALSKNEELKSALIEETPWLRDAVSEEEQKKRIALLFDLNKMADEKNKALRTIEQRQLGDGGFPWFEGPYSNRYITQYILEGIGHLDALQVDSDLITQGFVVRALNYMDNELIKQYEWLKKHNSDMKQDHLSSIAIHYLYVRSFYKHGISVNLEEAYIYYHDQAEKYWNKKGLTEQAMIALAKARVNKNAFTEKIARSVKERSIINDELGMYWKINRGYFWYEAPLERHALMIELFENQKDSLAVDQLKTWLLKNKQTNAWETTKATAAAVYALLITGDDWLEESEMVQARIGSKAIEFDASKAEAGTGYIKKQWSGNEVDSSFSNLELNNPNAHIAWGAAYYQYFEDLDKINGFEETPLSLNKELFKKLAAGDQFKLFPIEEQDLKLGDEIVVRIILKVDRDMEFVHLKDMRASGLEPLNTLSGYRWKSGLGYYESTKDLATHFFFDYLPKGSYVFEYPLRVFHAGVFSNGISTIQCMYAPEFSSHSSGISLTIEP